MKKIFIFMMLLVSSRCLNAQNSNVGIGTNSPINKLTVNGNSSIGSGYINSAAPNNGAVIQGNVGIGTTTPAAKLQVSGNVILDSAKYYSGNNASTLVRDNATGEVKTIATNTGNTKPLNYVQYIVKRCKGDWITALFTRIPTSIYTMTIIGVTYQNGSGTKNLLGTYGNSTYDFNSYSPHNVYAFQLSGYWYLTADYDGAQPSDDNGNLNNNDMGTWIIDCLVVNNSLIKSTTTASQDLGGSAIGSASAPPTGF